MEQLLDLLTRAQVYDLAQPFYPGMPHHPNHPPFLYGMTKLHGDTVAPSGSSSAADALAMCSHNGTHIDALCHFSCGGKLHGGVDVATHQAITRGLDVHSVDTIRPIFRRGVLLDIAGQQGLDALPDDFEITPAHLDAAAPEIRPGDVVLLRTGWSRYWNDARRFVAQVHGPGPAIAGARWLSDRKVFAGGADTLAFERVPDPDMPVHVHLLVESGIHIIENLNLDELAAAGVREFVFVAAPLKLTGATGSPIRPLALVQRA